MHAAGTLDEHMHLLLPALIRLFKVDASVDVRRAAIKTLTRLIPRVQVGDSVQFGIVLFKHLLTIWFHPFIHKITIFPKSGYRSYLCPRAPLEACLGWV